MVNSLNGSHHVCNLEATIRAGGRHDLLFAAFLYHHESNTRERRIVSHDIACIDVLIIQASNHLVAAFILSHPSDKSNPRSEARSSNGLIRSLAAGRLLELVTLRRLSPQRQVRSADEIVGVGTAYHHDIPPGRCQTAHGVDRSTNCVRLLGGHR